MPPKPGKKSRKATSSSSDQCCICYQAIGPKEDALFCSGSCQQFLHRYCASVSESAYKSLTSENSVPFYCFCCYKAQKEEQLSNLLAVVDSLKEEINALKGAAASTTAASGCDGPPGTLTQPEVAKVERPIMIPASLTSESTTANPALHSAIPNQDKKFNIVVYGINECPPGMSKAARLQSDLANVVTIFSNLESSIQPQSIKDLFRLGKFNSNASRPRPILVKFVSIADVFAILSKKRSLSSPYSIKPDRPLKDRLLESIIMHERWNLIQSGVSRNNIKLETTNCMYIISSLVTSLRRSLCVLSQIQLSHQLRGVMG